MQNSDQKPNLRDLPAEVMAVMQGMAARLDAVNIMFGDSPMNEIQSDLEEFFTNMALAGFFVPMVLKMQLPLESNMAAPNALVYNESKSVLEHVPVSVDLLDWFGGEPKIYVKARIWTNGVIQVIEKVEAQPW